MGDVINLGLVYWSEPESDELRDELKLKNARIERLEAQLAKSKILTTAHKIPVKDPEIKTEANQKELQSPALSTKTTKKTVNKTVTPRIKPKITPIGNLELDKSFYRVPRQVKKIQMNLNKLEILLLNHFFDKLHAWEKQYGLFSIRSMATEFKTTRKRIRMSLETLKNYQCILIIPKGNLGKIIFFNTEKNRKLIEYIKSGEIPFDIINKPWINDKKYKRMVGTICTHPLDTKQPRGGVQNEPEPGYKSTQIDQPETIEKYTNTATAKNNHSKNNSFIINQSDQEVKPEIKNLNDAENNLIMSNEEKYHYLKTKLHSRKLYEKRLKELITEHGINKVFYCLLLIKI